MLARWSGWRCFGYVQRRDGSCQAGGRAQRRIMAVVKEVMQRVGVAEEDVRER